VELLPSPLSVHLSRFTALVKGLARNGNYPLVIVNGAGFLLLLSKFLKGAMLQIAGAIILTEPIAAASQAIRRPEY